MTKLIFSCYFIHIFSLSLSLFFYSIIWFIQRISRITNADIIRSFSCLRKQHRTDISQSIGDFIQDFVVSFHFYFSFVHFVWSFCWHSFESESRVRVREICLRKTKCKTQIAPHNNKTPNRVRAALVCRPIKLFNWIINAFRMHRCEIEWQEGKKETSEIFEMGLFWDWIRFQNIILINKCI